MAVMRWNMFVNNYKLKFILLCLPSINNGYYEVLTSVISDCFQDPPVTAQNTTPVLI